MPHCCEYVESSITTNDHSCETDTEAADETRILEALTM